MDLPERELSKEEYVAWKSGDRRTRLLIRRGHQKIRINSALDQKIAERRHKQKKMRRKLRKRENAKQEALRRREMIPTIRTAP